MAKLWAKVNGMWVSLGAQGKDDVGLDNVENFTYTNSATDGSSSKYATGAAVKAAYDRATQALNKANQGISISGERSTSKRYFSGAGGLLSWMNNDLPSDALLTKINNNNFQYRRFQ